MKPRNIPIYYKNQNFKAYDKSHAFAVVDHIQNLHDQYGFDLPWSMPTSTTTPPYCICGYVLQPLYDQYAMADQTPEETYQMCM
jgi:hypothetical protein